MADTRSVDDSSRTFVTTSHFDEHTEEVNVGTHLDGETLGIAVEVGKKLVPKDFRVAKDKQIIYIDEDVHDACSINKVEQSFVVE